MNTVKFQKRPVVIDAVQLTPDNAADVAKWCGGEVAAHDGNAVVIIHTLEGDHRADIGDYVICGVKGEFYPCKPDIFWATYQFAVAESDK